MTITTAIGLQGDGMWPQNRWYGLFVPGKSNADFDAIADRLTTRPSVGGYFIRFDSKFDTSVLARFGDRGLTPMLTLEPWLYGMKTLTPYPDFSLAALNSGTRDADLTRIAEAIRDYDRPIYLRLAHEMNGHWYPWSAGINGNTAQDYLDFWTHVRTIFAIAPKIRWVWACAAIHNLRRSAAQVDTVFPGDDMVDFAGTTGYGWDKSASITYGKTFERLATLTDRDFVIPEMGAQAGTNRAGSTAAEWVDSFGNYLHENPRIRGFVWFHISQAIGATGDYRLDAEDTISALDNVLRTVPIRSNTSLRTLDGQLRVPDRDAVNPTTAAYAQNVINGHYCDANGPTQGIDKNGNVYECWIHPKGWNRWRLLP